MLFNLPFYLSGAGKSHIRYDLDSMAIANSLRNLDLLAKDTTSTIKSVQFYSSVSPEGSVDINARLSKIRIATAESIVREHLYLDDAVNISYKEQYVPWHQYIIPAVEADNSVPRRAELLKVLYGMPKVSSANTRDANKILREGDGEMWNILETRYFCRCLRQTRSYCLILIRTQATGICIAGGFSCSGRPHPTNISA